MLKKIKITNDFAFSDLKHITSIKGVVRPLKSQNISIASLWWSVVKVTPI